ncbi:MAG: hypothetical protein WCY98_05930 [Castellaniella sp.]
MAQRTIDLVIAIIASVISVLLSWPYWRDFEYWPESPTMWTLYFIVGFILAVYVFLVFISSLRTLFQHDEQARRMAMQQDETAQQEQQP